MAKKSNNEIPNLSEDWGRDSRNGLPYSGESVQKFIRGQLGEIGQKFGHVSYEGGKMQFYDTAGGSLIGTVAISGTSYIVRVKTNTASNNITVLTGDTTFPITLTPTTAAVEFGSSVEEDFFEDYTFSVEADDGSGYVDKTPEKNTIREGGTAEVNIRDMLKVGLTKIRINVTGVRSEQTKSTVLFVTLTSLSLSCDHPWQNAWIEGQDYYIQNIFLAGNVEKTLHIKVGDKLIEKTYSPTMQYVTVPANIPLEEVPSVSGVIPVEMWLSSEGAQTKAIRFNIMYASAQDKGTISLICTNKVKEEVVNFKEEVLLEYATYNVSKLRVSITASYEGMSASLVNRAEDIYPQTRYTLQQSLQIDTAATEGIGLEVTLADTVSGTAVTKMMTVDNSLAFIPVEGYDFYMNASLRSNEEDAETRQKILSSVPGNQKYYDAEFHGFNFKSDGWVTDDEGYKSLFVAELRDMQIGGYDPFKRGESSTFELMFKVPRNLQNESPLFIIGYDNEGSPSSYAGLLISSSKISLYGSSSSTHRGPLQSVSFSEGQVHHLTVVLQRNYANTGKNLARIYIDGCENVTFETHEDYFSANTAEGNLFGVQGFYTGFYVYMMRSYRRALEPSEVFANYLNAVLETSARGEIRKDNQIIDGNTVSYDMCKAAGLNCFVVETPNNGALPSLNEQKDGYEQGVNVHMEYADNPEWNVSIYDVPLDRQGTTSSLYYRANLRSKVKDSARWVYPNLGKEETGKSGYFAGYGLNPPVSKITWKKNVASQPQGHKMGATGFYNDLYKKVMGGRILSEQLLPSEQARVAVYQYPFMGFHKKNKDGEIVYEFIGLYTGGPDKTDKNTFGYNETGRYPNLMMIEGPNHDPLLTRFLVPWTEDVFFDSKNKTLSIGDPNATGTTKQEGWDADIVGDYSADDASQASQILALYNSEFKPAYDAVYYNSPYIASLTESGYTLEQINADITAFRRGTTNGYSNGLMTFYNSEYELVYYRVKTGKYEVLPKSTHDILSYLQLTGTPDTETIIRRRAENWTVLVGRYVDLDEAYFRQCFAELIGASDNDAKNSYWRKFRKIADGGKWGFNEDDLDTVFQTDNNGQDTKSPYIEPDDLTSTGGDIFQGRTSAFWFALRNHQDTDGRVASSDMRNMMGRIVDACRAIASEKGIYADTIHETVEKVIGHYFWERSSDYFPAMAYNEDTKWTYLDVWQKNPGATYNNVPPLTQIHGDHKDAELEWVRKRILYVFSKYQQGAFNGSDADGMGTLQFTPAEPFDLNISPFVDMYPCVSEGGSTISAGRTFGASQFGELVPAVIHLQGSESTGVYVKALDWIGDLGNLSGLKLSARADTTEIPFTVHSDRMLELKIGGGDSAEVKFNATSLSVQGRSFIGIYAQNVKTLTGMVDLTKCPSSHEIDFRGTNVSAIIPAPGAMLYLAKYPDSISTLFLSDLSVIEDDSIILPEAATSKIHTLYLVNCPNVNVVSMLYGIGSATGSQLRNVCVRWEGVVKPEVPVLGLIRKMALGAGTTFGGCEFDEGRGILSNTAMPILSGELDVSDWSIYDDDIAVISKVFPELKVTYGDKRYVTFEDPEVQRVVAGTYGDGVGTTREQLEKVTALNSRLFFGNTKIKAFDDLSEKMPNVVEIGEQTFQDCEFLESIDLSKIVRVRISAFDGCSALTEIDLPVCQSLYSYAFYDCASLVRVNLPLVENIGSSAFSVNTRNSSALISVNAPNVHLIGEYAFEGCDKLENIDFSNVESIGKSAFAGCPITEVVAPNVVNISQGAFRGCKSLERVELGGGITSIEVGVFSFCESLSSITATAIKNIYDNGFRDCTQLKVFGSSAESLTVEGNAFKGCSLLTEVSPVITSVGSCAFDGCAELAHITLAGLSTIYDGTFRDCAKLSYVDLSSVISIGSEAFSGCAMLSGIDISQVSSLKSFAFNGCKALTSVSIKCSTIEAGAFQGCTSLANVSLSFMSGVIIKNSAFRGCNNLSRITPLASKIGDYAFQNCTLLTAVPGNVKEIGEDAFAGCRITEVDLPMLMSIGRGAFHGCPLKSFKTQVLEIFDAGLGTGTEVFGTDLLREIDLSTVHTINGVGRLVRGEVLYTRVIFRSSVPPLLPRSDFFKSSPFGGGLVSTVESIYVPDDSVEAYKTAENWSEYASVIKPLSEYVEPTE